MPKGRKPRNATTEKTPKKDEMTFSEQVSAKRGYKVHKPKK